MQIKANDLKIPERRFRPELEGIRAVAAFLVAIYHVWLGTVSGGVDVFFIVSGYLITTSVLSRLERSGSFDYGSYLLNIGKRLFPNAFTVLTFTVIGSFLILPQVQWKQIVAEIYASLFYFENWQLARNAVDYLAQNNEASPVQHYWALSLQGQFYLFWPLIIFLSFFLARKILKTPFRKTLLTVLLTIFTLSITYSIYKTNVNQPWAYFDTFARAWEFSLGGILALLLPYITVNRYVSFIIGWLGLSIICLTGILLPVSTVFPGYAALLPITGVMLVIISAETKTKFGVESLLATRPFQYLGGISYAFYLWHWPLLIFYLTIFKTDTVPLVHGFIILGLAFILSVLSTNKIEAPIRNLHLVKEKKRIRLSLLTLMLMVLSFNTSWTLYHDWSEKQFKKTLTVENYPGARVLFDDIEPASDVKPMLSLKDDDDGLPNFYEDGCFIDMNSRGLKKCSYGNVESPKYTVAVVGGSRDGQWITAFEQFAEELELQVDIYNKDGCKFTSENFDDKLSDSCMEWNELVMDELLKNSPDLIFTTANGTGLSPTTDGFIDVFKQFEGITEIAAIRNTPEMPVDVPTCVEVNGAENCKVPRDEVLNDTLPWEDRDDIPSNVHFIDFSNYFCDEKSCLPVIGNVITFRDRYHLSDLYVETLAEPLKAEIEAILNR